MGFSILILCANLILPCTGNINDISTCSRWVVENTCKTTVDSGIIRVICESGNMYYMPLNECSISYLKK